MAQKKDVKAEVNHYMVEKKKQRNVQKAEKRQWLRLQQKEKVFQKQGQGR